MLSYRGDAGSPLRTKRLFQNLSTALVAIAALSVPARAQLQDEVAFRNTFGEVGNWETPTARMAPDGQLAFTYGQLEQQQRFNLSFQALPWLDTSFRYSHAVGRFAGYDTNHFYDRSFGMKARLFREGVITPEISFGIRDLLGTGIYSSEYVVASKRLGSFDISGGLGWGKLSERPTFGNPFGLIFHSMKKRDTSFGNGGVVAFGEFFRGPNVGAFGGVDWQTPIEGLHLVGEYSSLDYQDYVFKGGVHTRSPVNVGLAYAPFEALSISGAWMYGDTYAFTISLKGDSATSYPSALRIGPKVPAPAIRTEDQKLHSIQALSESSKEHRQALADGIWVKVPSPAEAARESLLQSFMSETRGVRNVTIDGKSLVVDARLAGNPEKQCADYSRIAAASAHEDIGELVLTDLQDPKGAVIFCAANTSRSDERRKPLLTTFDIDVALRNHIADDIRGQDIAFAGLSAQGSEIWVYFENYRYRNTAEAVGRVARILMKDVPPNIEMFHIIPCILGIPQQEITISRSGLERALENYSPLATRGDTIAVNAAPARNPGFDAFAGQRYPQLSYALNPKLTQHVFDPDHPIQFMVYADAPVLLQLMPGLDLEARATAQIWSNYTYTRGANSELPHVRSDVLKYLNHGKYGISSLDASYISELAPEVYTQVRAGYLEDMFFGAGGQVLWRPEASRLAFGADIYQVWQREYHRLFSLQHYNVLTGHVSMYYRSSWHDLNYAIHVGRYLAGDYGATFEITRRFETGVEIGAWATFTNVPFSKFGEGSFDKGIIVHIPFEWGLPIWSQSSYDLHLNSLTRDGGQRLAGDDSLFALTNGTSYGEITDHLGEIVEP